VLVTAGVFIDWSQNADYKTTVGGYLLRANSKPVRLDGGDVGRTWDHAPARRASMTSSGRVQFPSCGDREAKIRTSSFISHARDLEVLISGGSVTPDLDPTKAICGHAG
jgi:hypothetical protein